METSFSCLVLQLETVFSKGELMTAKEMGLPIQKHVLLHEKEVNVP